MNASDYAVLHIGMNPRSGIWSALRSIAEGQRVSGRYRAVGIGVLVDRQWPESYRRILEESGHPVYIHRIPRVIGTVRAMLQFFCRPPIEAWIDDLARQSGASRVIVHFHCSWMTGVFLPLRGATADRCTVVATCHCVNPVLERQPVRRALHRWMARRLLRTDAKLTSVDAFTLTAYRRILGIPEARFTVVHNTIPDTDRRGCPSLDGNHPFTVGYIGNFFEYKGWRLAADAVASLLERRDDIRLVLGGTGPEQDAAREFAERYPGKVEFLGFVENARDTVMPGIDLMTLLSEFEGFPMIILEAMSLGIPVAAAAAGDVPLQISEGAGFVIERSAAELAALIEKLADDPDLLRRTGHAARERFVREYSFDRIVEQYDAVYRA